MADTKHVATITGPQGPVGPPGEMSAKSPTPAGNVSTWTGIDKVGYYRLPTQTQVDAVSGRPYGAKPGTITILPVGSTTSDIRWEEYGPGGRIWTRTVSANADIATQWNVEPSTKHVGLALTLTGGSAPQVRTDFGGRYPINYSVDINTWRLRIRNFNWRDNVAYSGSLNITGISIAEAEVDANGNYTGAWIDGTGAFLQAPGATPSTGSGLRTDWFNYPLKRDKAYLISIGFTAAAGQTVVEGQGGGFILTNGSVAINSTAPAGTWSQTMPLELWIEAVVPDTTTVIGAVGDSLTVGVSSTLPVHDSWVAKLARTVGALPMLWAASGDTMQNSSNDLMWKFHQYKELARPDYLLYALGSNDIMPGTITFEEAKQRFFNSWLMWRKYTTTQVILCSVWPRLDPDAPGEAVRKQYNAWLRDELPGGATRFIDTAAAITMPDGSTRNPKWMASPTDIHLTSQGYARVATLVAGHMTEENQRYVIKETAGRSVYVWDYTTNQELLIAGETGLRSIVASWDGGAGGGRVELSRSGNRVQLVIYGNTATVATTKYTLPVGFRPPAALMIANPLFGATGTDQRAIIGADGSVQVYGTAAGDSVYSTMNWQTTDAWPAVLPGVAA